MKILTIWPSIVVDSRQSLIWSLIKDSRYIFFFQKNGAPRSIVRMGRRTFCACHHLSYGVHKIIAASPQNTPTKMPMAMPISMIPSWVDGELNYGFL